MSADIYNQPVFTDKLCVVGDDLWFVHSSLNLLFKVDLINLKQDIYVIPYKEKLANYYSDLLYYSGFLYLIPGNARRVVKFDINKEKFDHYDDIITDENIWKFCNAYIRGSRLICFPRMYEICEYDILSGEIVEINAHFRQSLIERGDFQRVFRISNDVFAGVFREKKGISYIDFEKETILEKKNEFIFGNYGLLDYYNDSWFFLDYREKKLKHYGTDGQLVKEVPLDYSCDSIIEAVYDKYIYVEDTINDRYSVFDFELNIIEENKTISFRSKYNVTPFRLVTRYKDDVIQFDNSIGEIRILDKHGNKLKQLQLYIDKAIIIKQKEYMDMSSASFERDISLDLFLDSL